MVTGDSDRKIEEFWDAHGVGAGEFMQLLDWADLEESKLVEQLDRVSMPAFVDDSETTCLTINTALRETFGVFEEDVHHLARLRAVSAARQKHLDSLVHRLWTFGEAFSASVELENKSSETRWYWMRSIPLKNAMGEVVRAIGLVIDIHDRVLTQLELERSESQFKNLFESLGDGVMAADAGGTIRFWNRAAATIFGYEPEEIIGQNVSSLQPQGKSRVEDFKRTIGEPTVLPRRRKDGSEVLVELNPMEVVSHGQILMVTTVRDVSEREAVSAERLKNEQQIRIVLDSLADPVVAIDQAQCIQMWNRAAERMFGYVASEVIGRPLSMLLPSESDAAHLDLVAEYFDSGKDERPKRNSPLSLVHRDGSPIRAEINLSKMTMDDNPIAIATIRDVSERERFVEAQLKSDEKFSALIERSRDTVLILDQSGVVSYASPAIGDLSGFSVAQTVGRSLAVILSNVHAEDHNWVEARIREIQGEVGARGEFGYRQLRTDGTVKYVSASVTNYLNVKGISGLVFNLRDISDARLLEVRVEHQNQELKAILAAFPDLLHQVSADGIVVRCLTPEAGSSLEMSQEAGKSLTSSMAMASAQEFEEVVAAVSRSKQAESVEISLPANAHSPERCVEARISPLPNGDVLASFRDVSVERKLQRQLVHQTLHDELTGLPNRTLLTDELNAAIENPEQVCVGVLFLDLDGFKEVNDRFGHKSGDELLVQVASRLATVVRPEDMVARIGGDEFVVVCADLHHHRDAEALADRICLSMGSPFLVDGEDVSITASIGIAFADEPGFEVEALIARADAAMYNAKELGKGRAEVFDATLF